MSQRTKLKTCSMLWISNMSIFKPRIQAVNIGTEYQIPKRHYNYTTELREVPGKGTFVSFTKNENLFQKGNQGPTPGEFLLFVKPDQVVKIIILSKENMLEYRVSITKEDLLGEKLDKYECLINAKKLFSLLSEEHY